MRILYVIHQFMPEFAGGTEQVALNLARAAQADGHHAEVLTVTLAGADRSAVVDGVPVHALTRDAPNGPGALGFARDADFGDRFGRYLDSRPAFDAAHVTHSLRVIEAAETLAARRIPYVMTLTDFFSVCHRINLLRLDGTGCAGPERGEACRRHCAAPEVADDGFGARVARLGGVLRAASAVVAVSEHVAERIRAIHPDLKLLVIGNGVDLSGFRPQGPRPGDRPLTFGYLGTLSSPKGADLLARAFVRAAPPGARLRLVGPCYDEELRERMVIATAGRAVSIEGAISPSAVGELMSGFDILCVPSQVPEAFSLALHEGFAAGLPALVSDLGNLGAVVRAHGCGRVVPADDEAAWAAAIGEVAASPGLIDGWKARTPLPFRVEEEAFLYGQIYRGLARLRATFLAEAGQA